MNRLSEFCVIQDFFKREIVDAHVVCGIGDDAALLNVPSDGTLAVTTDSLVEGIHFPDNTSWFDRGFKTAAVNLSDLAAMGAKPKWVSLSLCLPSVEEKNLRDFSQGFFDVLSAFDVSLIGGDLCRSPVWVATVTAQGFVPKNAGLRRSGAKVGDNIYVTDTVGDAGLALKYYHENKMIPDMLVQRFYRPWPAVNAGLFLQNIASSAIDVSDGLSADLQHILDESGVGARLQLDALPLSELLLSLQKKNAWQIALTGGDDYVLCFTASLEHAAMIAKQLPTARCIGVIEKEKGLRLFDGDKKEEITLGGFTHF